MTTLPLFTRQPEPGRVEFCFTACALIVNDNIPGLDADAALRAEDAKREICRRNLTAGGGGGGGGGIGEDCDGELTAAEGICNPWASPIIFDLGDRGYDLTSVDKGVQFDIDADGALEQVAWTERGSDDAFLALDRNGNGQIDGANELFGNFTKLANGKTSAHGYIPLAELDLIANGGNGNGYVDSADRDFGTLLLWTDRDHNGRSSSAELIPLGARGIFAIALDADESNVVDEHGNHLAYVSPAYAVRGFGIDRIRTTDIFFRYRELAR